MARKSFKENPALSFISQALEDHPPVMKIPEKKDHTDKHTDDHTDIDEFNNTSTHDYVHMSDVSKVLPSTSAHPVPLQQKEITPPMLTRRNESKSKRLQLLLRPTTYAGISRLAQEYHTSVNDAINQILEDALQRQIDE